MKFKIGFSADNGVISIEEGWYRIFDDTDEDYLFSPDEFEVIPEDTSQWN